MTKKTPSDYRKIDPNWVYLIIDEAYKPPKSFKEKFLHWHSAFASGGPFLFWFGIWTLIIVFIKPSAYMINGIGSLVIASSIGGAMLAASIAKRKKKEEIPIARVYVDGTDMGFRALYPSTKEYLENHFRGKEIKFDARRYIFDYIN